MGFELNLYVARPWRHLPLGYQVLATVDLGKLSHTDTIGYLHEKAPRPGVWVFADGGDTEITEDAYAQKLSLMDIKHVIKALEHDIKSDLEFPVPRYSMAVALLKECKKGFPDAVVIGYGY